MFRLLVWTALLGYTECSNEVSGGLRGDCVSSSGFVAVGTRFTGVTLTSGGGWKVAEPECCRVSGAASSLLSSALPQQQSDVAANAQQIRQPTPTHSAILKDKFQNDQRFAKH